VFVPCIIIRFGKDDEYRKKPREGLFWFYTILCVWETGGGNWGEKARKEEKEERGVKGGKRAIFDKVAKNVDLEQFYTDSDHSLYEFRPGTI
jgi:hypothetical protein